jgi:hypothetical protein
MHRSARLRELSAARAEPVGFTDRANGDVEVRVHQTGRDAADTCAHGPSSGGSRPGTA